MAEYTPSSRRPIADLFRKTAHGSVRACVKLNIHPDLISYASIVFAALAGLCFWKAGQHPWLLIIAPIFCYLRLWMNMLDGMVALAAKKASLHGEIVNELPDRISDVLIFMGVAHSGFNLMVPAYIAAILAVLTAYVGIMGQAVGVQREFSGVMAKPIRMVVLHIGAWITYGLITWGNGNITIASLRVLDWANLIVILGCIQTIWIRLVRINISLKKKGRNQEA